MGESDPDRQGRKPDKKNGLKMSELSAITGVSRQAIHFYLREGLLEPGEKTSQNMAYYSDSHVERINLIKKLQETHRLKLSEIKEILSGDAVSIENGAAVIDAFDFLPGEDVSLSAGELMKRSGLSRKDFEKLVKSGFIKALDDGPGRRFGASSLELARLSKGILDAGYSDDYLINVLKIFETVSEELAKREIENYFKQPLGGVDIGVLADTFRDTEPYLEKTFWLLRRRALGGQVDGILGDFGLFSWMTGKELKREAGTILPSEKYMKPLDVPGKIDLLRSMAEEGSGDALSYTTLAIIYYARGDKKEQLKWITRALESDPDNKWVLLLLGDAYTYSQSAEKGEEALSRCAELYPEFALAHCLLATAMLMAVIDEKRIDKALAVITGALRELEQARELAATEGFEHILLRSLRGRALLLLPAFMGVFNEAVDELRKAEKLGEKEKKATEEPYYLATIDSLLMNVYYDLGRAADRVGNLKERDKYWKKVLSIDPTNKIAPYLKRKMA